MTAAGPIPDHDSRGRDAGPLLLEHSPDRGDLVSCLVFTLFGGVFASVLIAGLLRPKSVLAGMFVGLLLALLILFWWSAVGRSVIIWHRVWFSRDGIAWQTSIFGRWRIRTTTIPLDDVRSVQLEWNGEDSFRRRDHYFVFDTHTHSKRWVHVGWAPMVDGAVNPRVLALWNGLFRHLDPSLDLSGLSTVRRAAPGE